MYAAQKDKPKENKNRVVVSSAVQKKGKVVPGFGFVDNRQKNNSKREMVKISNNVLTDKSMSQNSNIDTCVAQLAKYGIGESVLVKNNSMGIIKEILVDGGSMEVNSVYVVELSDGTNRETLGNQIVDRPGRNRIELGAGDMASAASEWHQVENTAFTEFRTYKELLHYYGQDFTINIDKTTEPYNRKNDILYGVDATHEGPYRDLSQTNVLRFTNPNIGGQDIGPEIEKTIDEAINHNYEGHLYYSSMGLTYFLDLTLLKKYASSNGHMVSEDLKQNVIITTAGAIANCRNIQMMHKFMQNAPSKLLPGASKVEIILSSSYLHGRWPILEMAEDMGYTIDKEGGIELGFENIKTQKNENVQSGKKQEKSKITLTLPLNGAIKKTSVISYLKRHINLDGTIKNNIVDHVLED